MSCGDPVTPEWLIGMTAESVVRSFGEAPGRVVGSIVDGARRIAGGEDGRLGGWVLAGYSEDGGSTWVSPDGTGVARVDGSGPIRIHQG